MRLIIFDCDGTLVDSQGRIVASMKRAADDLGLPAAPADAVRASVGLSLDAAARRLYPASGEKERSALVENYRRAFHELSVAEGPEPLFPGCREALHAFEAPGELLAVATGKSRRGLLRVLEQHRLQERFIDMATADDGPSKPNPTSLLEMLDRCGARPEDSVIVGDTSFDMELGRNAGVRRVGVAWGYHPREELRDAGAERIADRFEEIPDLTRNLLG